VRPGPLEWRGAEPPGQLKVLARCPEVAPAELEQRLDRLEADASRRLVFQGLGEHAVALLPVAQVVEIPGHRLGQEASHRPLQAELPGGCQAAAADVVGLPQPAPAPQHRAEVDVGAGDPLGVTDLLGDPAGREQVLGVAGAAPQDIQGMSLLRPGPDRPGHRQRFLGPS
jgi:hypothetical protein